MHKRYLLYIVTAAIIITLLLPVGCSCGKTTTSQRSTTTSQPTTTKAGAVIQGFIYYNGHLITEYTDGEAIIGLVGVDSREDVSAQCQYDNQTGGFKITGVPPGEYMPSMRIESGHPFDIEAGGDFTGRVSGTNPNIVVASATDVIDNDLAVLYHIHLTNPIDNQERTRSFNDEHDNI